MSLLDWLYTPKCVLCESIIPINGPRGFCEKCAGRLLKAEAPYCERCGRPKEMPDKICKECKDKDMSFVKNRSTFIYDENMRDIIHRFKYGNHPGYGKHLGGIMAANFDRHFQKFDLIIPVPLSKQRHRERGFNQSEILAREIALKKGIALCAANLKRIRDTAAQSGLTAKQRSENLAGAFKASNPSEIDQKTILLVDDIFTTGSTINYCAMELMAAGAHEVYSSTLAIALKKD